MNLTKNERKTLKLILNNARISDIDIAKQLHISSQAVGKIRKKLEREIIQGYTVKIDYSKLGIQTFAICLSKLTQDGLNEGELEVEQKLQKSPNIIQVYRLPSGHYTYVMLYGFRDMSELEDFFHSPKKKEDMHRFIETKEIFTFSHNSLIKNNPVLLFNKMLEEFTENSLRAEFEEIQRFKKRNWR